MNPGLFILVAIVPALACRWGRRRRAAGLPVSPREVLTLMLLIWAVGLPVATLSVILKAPMTSQIDKIIVTSLVLAAAVAPLAVDRLIRWALRLVRRWEVGTRSILASGPALDFDRTPDLWDML